VTRCVNLQLSESQVLKHCAKRGIGVSVIEPLASGGVRLVCMSSDGAEQVRRDLRTKMIDGETIRTQIRPRGSRL
jgi:predicted aldo/keto reductase-like oxidoreductase